MLATGYMKEGGRGRREDAEDAHAHFSFEVPAWHAASVATATATTAFLVHTSSMCIYKMQSDL